MTTDAAGDLVSELRYKPWGDTRYSSGATPTDYTFTGQYSNVSDIGLMFYNARWYDPSLGRFASADCIVPPGAQGYDRYAYVNNSPVMFTDPTGHFGNHNDEKSDYWNKRNKEKVKQLEGKWEKEGAARGLENLVNATAKEIALDSSSGLANFFGVFGGGDDCPFFCKLGEAIDPFHLIAGGGILFVSSVAAGIGAAVGAFPEGLIVAPVFAITAVVGLDVALFGVQKLVYQGTNKKADPLVLVHVFFPEFGR